MTELAQRPRPGRFALPVLLVLGLAGAARADEAVAPPREGAATPAESVSGCDCDCSPPAPRETRRLRLPPVSF